MDRALLLAGMLLWAGCAPSEPAPRRMTAVGGVLDLRGWDAERDGPVTLEGEWVMAWRELVDPEAGCLQARGSTALVDIPRRWNGLEVAGREIASTGYASYCLTVLLPQRHAPLSIRFPRVKTAGSLFVDGRRVAGEGEVGTSVASSRPVRVDHLVAVRPSERMDLVVHVSNFHFRNGGLDKALTLGSPLGLEPWPDRLGVLRSIFFVGAFVVLGLYHLILGVGSSRRLAPLSFAAICLAMALYQLTRENGLFVAIFPWIPWTVEIRLEYTLFGILVPLTAVFVTALYPREFTGFLSRLSIATAAVFVVLVWSTSILVSSQWILLGFQICFLLLALYGGWRMGQAILRRRPGAHWFLIGCGLWVIAGLCDGLLVRFFPGAPPLLPYGFFAIVLAQAVMLATAQRRAASQARALSNRLMKVVSEKLLIEREAYRDPLTGLDNRRRLDEGVRQLRRRSDGEREEGDWVSLLYLDIDDFKAFNDRYGHDVGDEILIGVAGRLRAEVGPGDLSVRLGGDEFVVLLPGLDAVDAAAQAERLAARMARPLRVGDREVRVSVSIGLASQPADRVDLGELLRQADRAMYAEKRRRGEGGQVEGWPAPAEST